MYHNLVHDIRCSKCASLNYEKFEQKLRSGTRCLNCGHEKVNKSASEEQSQSLYENAPSVQTF